MSYIQNLIRLIRTLIRHLLAWLHRLLWGSGGSHWRRKRAANRDNRTQSQMGGRTAPKPAWVSGEVLRLKALMPGNGCRKIADTFNYLHETRIMTVGKTYVANTLRSQGEAIVRLRRELKHRIPKKVPNNLIWALDLTFVDSDRGPMPIFGLIDHGTRACLALQSLPGRGSIHILRILLGLVETYGKPKILRTDNEPIFTSWLFRLGLALLGIRHQRTAPFAPWQNGRIERLFGTFKERLRVWRQPSETNFVTQTDLDLFRAWYNGVRTHQHLSGIVPAEAWAGRHLRASRPRYFNAWEGALTGFY